MARSSKTVTLCLIDGELTGRIRCTAEGWIGTVYKSPRKALNQFWGKDFTLLQQAGVYLLFGIDTKNNQSVYIGQSGVRKNGKGLLSRVEEFHASFDWTEAILVTTIDNSFGLDDISYLKNRLYDLAMEVGRYLIITGDDPNPGNLSDERVFELEDYIDNIKIVTDLLGNKVLESDKSKTQDFDKDDPILCMRYNKGVAMGKRTNDGFVIFKGSTINPGFTESCRDGVKKLRKKYANNINKENELTTDIFMKSPSTAAKFIGGAELNGRITWRDAEGRTLKEIEEARCNNQKKG